MESPVASEAKTYRPKRPRFPSVLLAEEASGSLLRLLEICLGVPCWQLWLLWRARVPSFQSLPSQDGRISYVGRGCRFEQRLFHNRGIETVALWCLAKITIARQRRPEFRSMGKRLTGSFVSLEMFRARKGSATGGAHKASNIVTPSSMLRAIGLVFRPVY